MSEDQQVLVPVHRRTVGAVPSFTVTTTAPTQLLDITDRISAALGDAAGAGAVLVSCPHTTCGLLVGEVEEGFTEDLAAVLDEIAPMSRAWAHDDATRRWQNIEPDERVNGHSHIRYTLAAQPSLVLPVVDGTLSIGSWQRVLLLELDGPRAAREVRLGLLAAAG